MSVGKFVNAAMVVLYIGGWSCAQHEPEYAGLALAVSPVELELANSAQFLDSSGDSVRALGGFEFLVDEETGKLQSFIFAAQSEDGGVGSNYEFSFSLPGDDLEAVDRLMGGDSSRLKGLKVVRKTSTSYEVLSVTAQALGLWAMECGDLTPPLGRVMCW